MKILVFFKKYCLHFFLRILIKKIEVFTSKVNFIHVLFDLKVKTLLFFTEKLKKFWNNQ